VHSRTFSVPGTETHSFLEIALLNFTVGNNETAEQKLAVEAGSVCIFTQVTNPSYQKKKKNKDDRHMASNDMTNGLGRMRKKR
jgi:hypothetical protein